ncbi:hypothetical protein G647_02414, partial [Cladophialophora carrionii CBS 160.54]
PNLPDEGKGICSWGMSRSETVLPARARLQQEEEAQVSRNSIPLSEHDKRVSRVLETMAEKKAI